MKEIELINLRKKREKHFLQSDGSIIAKVYNEDIHFEKDNKYIEIDNTLIKENNYYKNRQNAYQVYFKNISIEDFVKIKLNNHYIDISLLDSNGTIPIVSKNSIIYQDIIQGIDIEYLVLANKIKENIIIKDKNKKINELDYIVSTDLNLEVINNSVLAHINNNTIFTIEAPYMIDSNNNINYNIQYQLVKYDQLYHLKLILDDEWLESASYPITIDPTITNSGNSNSVYDTYIYPNDTNIDRNNQDILKVGVEKVNNQNRVNRTLIKFTLPTITTGSQVVGATLDLIGYGYNEAIYDSEIITVHQLTKDWNEQTANWNTMNNSYNSRVEAYFNNYFSTLIYDFDTKTYQLHSANCIADITNLVRKWYSDTPNYGIMLKTNEEIYKSTKVPAFYSKNNHITGYNPKPILIIKYRNQNGLENYMDYQSQVFSQGNVYINTYTGNLTGLFNLGNTISGKLPASLNLIYNTNDVILNNNYGLGIGYKLNYYQTIKTVIIEDINYLEYLDEDGTIHYFIQEEINNHTKYKDEDGLNMTIEVSDNTYILKDKENNQMKFIIINGIGYLQELIDLSNNKITIMYNDDQKIIKVVDANESEITISYNLNNIVITSLNETVTLNYSNNRLTSIVSKLGTTLITYNTNNLIETITDINSLKIKYEYYEVVPYRIYKVLEYGLNDTLGNYYYLSYGFDATTIVDNKNRAITKTFNRNGNLSSTINLTDKDILDESYGMYEEYGEEYFTGDMNSTKYKNKLLTKRIPIKYINNYLTNSSFETTDLGFDTYGEVYISSSDLECYSGHNSLRCGIYQDNSYIKRTVKVPKGKYYTLSIYMRNDVFCYVSLSYEKQSYDGYNSSIECEVKTEWQRESVTIFYPEDATSDLKIIIDFPYSGYAYFDDMQLEEGKVANNYNMLDNSNFNKGLTDWVMDAYDYERETDIDASNIFSVVNVDSSTKALKIAMNPIYSSSIRKTYNITGKKGDVYNVSFWYKNEGLYASGLIGDLVCNTVTILYHYKDVIDEDGNGMCTIQIPPFNINDKEWQYYSYSFVAIEDFDSFELLFYQDSNANTIYITNISLIKDIREVNYDYDSNGNIITTSNLDNKVMKFNYDSNNQLIKLTQPMGNNFCYEYDNIITDRILSGLSSNNITNQIEYDQYNNPILTKITHKTSNDINGSYQIRLKGTNKYIRNIKNQLVICEDHCHHDIWCFEKIDDFYKIKHNIINNKYLSSIKEAKILENTYHAVLTNDLGDDSLFKLEKNLNGSYYIILNYDLDPNVDTVYLKYDDEYHLSFDKLEEDDYHYEFYLETTEDKLFIENKAEYTNDGKFIKSTTNTLLNKTNYDINPINGLINKVTDPIGNITSYTYDSKERLIQTKYNDRMVSYTYNNYNVLSKINNNNIEYNLIYDDFFNIKQVKINNNIPLITNNYELNNGNLLSTTYGNNNTINYTYDEYDRINSITKMDNIYNYYYDNNGNLVNILGNYSNTYYIYDLAKKLHEYRYNDFKIKYTYDPNSNIIKRKYILEHQQNNIINNEYNTANAITKTIIDETDNINYTYDTLGRITNRNINNIINTNYEYITLGNRTSTLIKSINNNNDKYLYRYDKLNNIKGIYHNNTLEHKYYYDNYNQLIKEINYLTNEQITYTYDTNGNILTKQILNLTTNISNINTYEYSNNNWCDQLTKYNNINITYDEIGNPITIGNNILTWINGRQLKSYNNINYKYNISGIRTSKIVNNIETKYYVEGTSIIFEQTGYNVIYYIRNEVDNLIGFKYNNEIYYYEKNIQGDIIAIKDNMNNIIAKYTYDIWGNILSITDSNDNNITDTTHIGYINPYRYRSYYYDTETNLYYLNSRYYNPVWGRFINADGIVGANQDILSYNLYAYCSNNPVNCSDPSGMFVGDSIVNFTNEAVNNAKLASKDNVIKKTNQPTYFKYDNSPKVCKPNVGRNYCTYNEKNKYPVSKPKPSIIYEEGEGSGRSFGASLSGNGFAYRDYIDDVTKSDLMNHTKSCVTRNVQGITIGPFGFDRIEERSFDCDTYIYDDDIKISYVPTFGPISYQDGKFSIFIGIQFDLHTGVGRSFQFGIPLE